MDDLKDLHIHIEQGPYTVEWIEKFIHKAEEMHLNEINLLEHSIRMKEFHPVFADAMNYNAYQRKWAENKIPEAHTLDEFKKLADKIRKKDYPVKVSFGLEICWFEQYEDYIRNLVSDGYFDYLIGSVHWIDNWTFNQRKYQWKSKDVNQIYKRYFELQNSLAESNIFDIIAHPDLIMCHSIYPDYDLRDTYRCLCQNANYHNVKIEMNTSKGKKMGLNKQFFDIALQEKVQFTAGSDAHCPEDVGKGIKEVYNLINHR